MFRRLTTRIPKLHSKRTFALNKLDWKLEEIIDFRGGFFVEAGANDGVRQSNTLFFEKYKGWNGILIEPIPALAAKCRQNRPKCIVENCALISAQYSEPTVQMYYCDLMSIVLDSADDMDKVQAHVESGRQHLSPNDEVFALEVVACTLTDVLQRNHVESIDLLSLDVEGNEAEVLSGLDFSRYQPRYMLIEVRSRHEIELVLGNAYRPVAILSETANYQDILYEHTSNE